MSAKLTDINTMVITDNKTSLSDIPFKEDVNDFGTERYVDGLIKFIENSSAPITIALQGEWGSGKTSLMTRLERALCGKAKSQFVGVEINTWEYSMMSSPEVTVYKILTKLVQELTKDDPQTKDDLKRFLRGAGKFIYRGVREGLKTFSPGIGMLIEAANIPTLQESTDENESVSLSDLKNTLEQAVQKTISEASKRGVIVFVDDLDRLNPPVAVEILELLKNIFCISNCIFILAIDYEVVVKGLEPKFGKMTDKNEREFRSFFDKIIQVPFSLPVNSYRPMEFVLDSLVKIGYITAVEKGDERFKRPFREIVEWSVGKNPRSIKRLVNTLSLLSCIAKSGKDQDVSGFTDSREGRIVTFAIVAFQVCYSKIYRMLALMPNFTKWDNTLASRLNIQTEHKDKDHEPYWEEILEIVCMSDNYLTQHFNDIRFLLFLIKDTLKEYETVEQDAFEEKIRSVIDKSSVTGISEPSAEIEIDRKRLIAHLHNNVYKRILQKRQDIPQIQCKNNTGNGGFFLSLPDGKSVEIIIRPRVVPGKIACELLLATQIRRPEEMMGKSWDDMLGNETVNAALAAFDRVISPLLQDLYYFEGHIYPETKMGTYFKSFTAEQAYRCSQGWQPDHICQNASYWISLNKEVLFEDKAVVDTIADVIIATYDLRKATMDL